MFSTIKSYRDNKHFKDCITTFVQAEPFLQVYITTKEPTSSSMYMIIDLVKSVFRTFLIKPVDLADSSSAI